MNQVAELIKVSKFAMIKFVLASFHYHTILFVCALKIPILLFFFCPVCNLKI